MPIEDSVGEMARLVAEGQVRALGLSEVISVPRYNAANQAEIDPEDFASRGVF